MAVYPLRRVREVTTINYRLMVIPKKWIFVYLRNSQGPSNRYERSESRN